MHIFVNSFTFVISSSIYILDGSLQDTQLKEKNQTKTNSSKPVSYTHLTLPTNREV